MLVPIKMKKTVQEKVDDKPSGRYGSLKKVLCDLIVLEAVLVSLR